MHDAEVVLDVVLETHESLSTVVWTSFATDRVEFRVCKCAEGNSEEIRTDISPTDAKKGGLTEPSRTHRQSAKPNLKPTGKPRPTPANRPESGLLIHLSRVRASPGPPSFESESDDDPRRIPFIAALAPTFHRRTSHYRDILPSSKRPSALEGCRNVAAALSCPVESSCVASTAETRNRPLWLGMSAKRPCPPPSSPGTESAARQL